MTKKKREHLLCGLGQKSQKILRAHGRYEGKFGLELHGVARGHSRKHQQRRKKTVSLEPNECPTMDCSAGDGREKGVLSRVSLVNAQPWSF